ncbi:hypothetical protein WJX79_007234 [Trebouxia sp. C0005]
MPRRVTLTYSSADAPAVGESRVTDGARVIDTKIFTAKLYTTEGGSKLIKRQSGNVEKQYRYNIGKLPVAYRAEPDGQFLYVIEGAVTSYTSQDPAQGSSPPVPPCILPLNKDTTQVSLEIDDRADKPSIIKISADHVRIEIAGAITAPETNEEILEFMRALLAVRLSQMSLIRECINIGRAQQMHHLVALAIVSNPVAIAEDVAVEGIWLHEAWPNMDARATTKIGLLACTKGSAEGVRAAAWTLPLRMHARFADIIDNIQVVNNSLVHKVDNAQHRDGWYGSVTFVLGVSCTQSLHDVPHRHDS